jgi:steroid 5-alpha reductase family enzyme
VSVWFCALEIVSWTKYHAGEDHDVPTARSLCLLALQTAVGARLAFDFLLATIETSQC